MTAANLSAAARICVLLKPPNPSTSPGRAVSRANIVLCRGRRLRVLMHAESTLEQRAPRTRKTDAQGGAVLEFREADERRESLRPVAFKGAGDVGTLVEVEWQPAIVHFNDEIDAVPSGHPAFQVDR